MAWLSGWGNNILRMTVDSSKVDSNLTDFPVLVTISSGTGANGDFDATHIFDELGSSYNKLAITAADQTTQLPVEVEYWDETEEIAHLWTKLPNVYSSTDTTLYLYYDATQSGNVDYVSRTTDAHAEVHVQTNTEGTYDDKSVTHPRVIKDGDDYKMWYCMRSVIPDRNRIGYCVSSGTLNNWQDHQLVIDLGDEGTYDTIHAIPGTVMKEGSTYKMWYSGHDGSNYRVIYCTSTNGTTWSGHSMVMNYNNITADSTHVYDPRVMKDGTTYKMWYTGHDGSNWTVCYAQSTNGTSWTGHQQVIDHGGGGDYDAHLYAGNVVKEGSTYKMWLSGADSSNVWRAVYASSTNGTTWTNPARIFNVGLEGSADATRAVFTHTILDDGVYRMWYCGWDTTHPYSIMYTHSNTDGYRWTFGNAAVGVWTNDFMGVWHLAQDPSGGTESMKDSSGRLLHGDPSGLGSGDLVEGKVGEGIDFGGSDYIQINDGTMLDSDYSISFSLKPDSSTFNPAYGNDSYDAGASNSYGRVGFVASAVIWDEWDGFQYGGATYSNTWSAGNWSNITFTINRSSTAKLYMDGVSKTLTGNATYENDPTRSEGIPLDDFKLGARTDKPSYLLGVMDEVRASKVVRSEAWAKADHNSVNNTLLNFDPVSYLEGQCTDRYGVAMQEECGVIALDALNHSVLGYGTSISGTGRFSLRVYGKEAGNRVLVAYGYPGDYGTTPYPAGAEYMTTISGTTLSGGAY